ncbi:M23 family metallopeptidase [Chitinophaga pinensis]|uniref:Peptidase M23 n=1 Tax=Chitinophaga pinensis (strain ATCC 43595 / DSM 2588 / LMG 13176 / NBRC 15968 / NCIMB 11800 / UQM 2034) TaxID=485918 RepID=A0A979GQJ7_CHIPD|nr:M23 family metallopeptidase [Chitinophaga pinensis]ACU61567.1 Peptidase M23 [Chitinophaga pinensis DSM 2588]
MKLLLSAAAALLCMQTFAQDPQQEEKESPELLYKAIQKPTLAIPQGADGDEISNKPAVSRFRTITPSRKIVAQKQVIFTEADAPGIAMFRSGSCAPPVVEDGLDPVYSGVKAHMPLYLPYKSGSVGIWQGFYYSWDNDNNGAKDPHRAIDYGKSSVASNEDPTFGVYAIAPGKVIDVYWSNGGGNIVIIEHTAPDGFKYRSRYLHLRNGYDNDRGLAKNSPTAKYKSFATSGTSSNLCWGTNSQTIKVKKNDIVQAGQFIAYSGNTGSGGIGVILNDDGTLKNADTKSFNVHLHFEVSVLDTRTGHSGEWVNVDPYGTYNHSSVSCYDLGAVTPYERLFAPFYPSFHNVPLDLVNKYWAYYTGMGMALQTVSVDRNGSSLYAAGSFQWGLSTAWYARFYMTGSTYQTYFNTYNAQGMRPRQISVTKDGSGNPRFSVIWEKNPGGQAAYSVHNADDATFDNAWKTYVTTKKWHVQEHVDYTVNGKRLHAAVFVNKPNDNGFYLYYGMNSTDFNNKFNELYPNWELKSICVNGSKVGGVWRPKKNNYAAYYGMSSSDYQSKFNQFSSQGLRLLKVQNYDDNARFSAVWGK